MERRPPETRDWEGVETLPGSRGQKAFACHGHGQLNERSTVLCPQSLLSSVRCPPVRCPLSVNVSVPYSLFCPLTFLLTAGCLVSQIVQLHQQKVRKKMLLPPWLVDSSSSSGSGSGCLTIVCVCVCVWCQITPSQAIPFHSLLLPRTHSIFDCHELWAETPLAFVLFFCCFLAAGEDP